jgi:hypothetical protein
MYIVLKTKTYIPGGSVTTINGVGKTKSEAVIDAWQMVYSNIIRADFKESLINHGAFDNPEDNALYTLVRCTEALYPLAQADGQTPFKYLKKDLIDIV